MPFDIDQFKGTVTKEDFLRPSHYETAIRPPVGDGEILRLRTESISLPGSSFASVDAHKAYGTGRLYSIPHTFNPQEISCTYTVDAKAKVIQVFSDWSNYIVEHRGQGDGKYTANFFDEYTVDATIFCFSGDYQHLKTIQLIKVYPSSVDQVQLSWNSTDETVKLNVSYRYLDYIVS